MTGTTPDADDCCKVGRVAAVRDVDGLDDRIVARHRDGESLRDLATFVNRTLFARAVEAADVRTVEDAATLHDLLTDDDADAGRRAELRSRLERGGVDVGALEAEFVSHQTVRDHLRDCLGVDTGREGTITPDDAFGVIDWSRARTESVVAEKVRRLRADGQVALGEFDVDVVVRVTCRQCSTTASLHEVIAGGGCGCTPPDGSADAADGRESDPDDRLAGDRP